MPDEKYKTVISIGFSNVLPDQYLSAIPGTYDASFFIDPGTQKFCFPAYDNLFKGMISIKDETKYKREYFSDLSAKEKANFKLDDFESNFCSPSFTIEAFSDFLDRIPAASFNKGISKDGMLYLFKKFQRYINDEPLEKHYLLDKDKSTDAIRLGLLTVLPVDRAATRKLWDEIKITDIRDTCNAHNIPTASKADTMIERLMEKDIAFPYNVVVPSALLKETWHSFVDMYTEDIRASIDLLHPLYLEPVWEDVRDSNYGKSFKKRIDEIIAQLTGLTGLSPKKLKTMNKFSNNPVFTMPEDLPPGTIKLKSSSTTKYFKAVAGSFDASYFVNKTTGGFCFPDYNNNSKAFVKVKLTVYDENKFNSLDEFEQNFGNPVFEVPGFETFLTQLPAGHLPAGISVDQLLEQFEEFETLISGEEKVTDFFEQYRDPSVLTAAKLLERIDLSKLKPQVAWDNIPPIDVDEICVANGIKPVEDNDKNIQKLVAKGIPFPFTLYRPTIFLKELYWKLIDQYIDDIKAGTDHFHPLYLQPLWEEVYRNCGNAHIEDKVEAILSKKSWKQRLAYGR